ncbi:MAG: DNA polymerase III subunit delta' [Ruminococcaceae bacterium]|nr:DNA polymerase III subunit delta' [Oscillospiraceae bacterium]
MIFPLIGNEKTALTVNNFIKEQRIPHAILIVGDSGVGKHTLADFLAQSIVCGKTDAPCGECENCRAALSNNHPDITTVAPEDNKKNIAVDQVRTLRQEAFIRPHKAQKRVFIIDKADTMNQSSQNALLKVLEEPPEAVMFLLIAENNAAFLDTVISRCVVLNLTVPEREKAVALLSENRKYSREDIISALDSAQNNIGRAKRILSGKAGTKAETAAEEFLKYLFDDDQYNMLLATNAFAKKRVDSDAFLKALKNAVAKRIKADPKSHFAKPLMAFYNEISSYEQQLLFNINLNLFFSNLVCSAIQIFWRNK